MNRIKHSVCGRFPMFLLLACTILFLMKSGVSGPNQGPYVKLTFIANEGVLIETHSHKVLIDALFDNPHPAYAAPSPDILERLETGQPPFDAIDLVLVTHDHPDHFSIRSALRFLKKNPHSKLIAPADCLSLMRKSGEHWISVEPRVIPFDIGVDSKERHALDGIDLLAYRTLHSGDLEDPWNLMYLIEMDGMTISHEGDSDGKRETFEKLGLTGQPIDLALVHFWFPLHPVGAGLLQEVLDPAHIGLFHLPLRLYTDAPKKIAMISQYYPDIFLLTESMEQRVLKK